MPRAARHFRDRSQPPQDTSQYMTAASVRPSSAASSTGSGFRKGMMLAGRGLSRFFKTFRKHATQATPTPRAPRHDDAREPGTAPLGNATNATFRRFHVGGFA